jgi:tetratricopeptide (TPR) repeat protein
MKDFAELMGRAVRLTQQQHHAEAITALRHLLLHDPDHRAALYLLAINYRLMEQHPHALHVLDRLRHRFPAWSPVYQEYGQCYVAMRDLPRAIDAIARSVSLNPALPACWAQLIQLYRLARDHKNVALAEHNLTLLNQLPTELIEATQRFYDEDLESSQQILMAFLEVHPRNTGALRLLARVHLKIGNYSEAESLLAQALIISPDFIEARLEYGTSLLHQQKFREALVVADHLLAKDGTHPEYLKLRAACCVGLGHEEAAIPVYDDLIARAADPSPDLPDLLLWRGNALKAIGEESRAVQDYQRATTLSDLGLQTADIDQERQSVKGTREPHG